MIKWEIESIGLVLFLLGLKPNNPLPTNLKPSSSLTTLSFPHFSSLRNPQNLKAKEEDEEVDHGMKEKDQGNLPLNSLSQLTHTHTPTTPLPLPSFPTDSDSHTHPGLGWVPR